MSDRKFRYRYDESYVPPRCRKPRLREIEGVLEYDFRRATAAEAPVAIMQRNRSRLQLGEHQHHGDGRRIEYRWHGGRLWAPVRLSSLVCLNGARNRRATVRDVYARGWNHESHDHASACAALKGGLDARWLLVDGVLHESIGEPLLVVQTFGLGCNHGGTALLTDNSYNPNIAASAYFRIDERGKAEAEFSRVAERRGDTNSLTNGSGDADDFDVLMPEVLRRRPSKDHGDGDPFINQVEGVVRRAKDPTVAGFAALLLAVKDVPDGRIVSEAVGRLNRA